MADYSDIIDEFKAVSDAFTSVNYFKYNKVSDINGSLQDKAYPLILVKSSPNTSRGNVNNLGLPTSKKYTFDIFCLIYSMQKYKRLRAYRMHRRKLIYT